MLTKISIILAAVVISMPAIAETKYICVDPLKVERRDCSIIKIGRELRCDCSTTIIPPAVIIPGLSESNDSGSSVGNPIRPKRHSPTMSNEMKTNAPEMSTPAAPVESTNPVTSNAPTQPDAPLNQPNQPNMPDTPGQPETPDDPGNGNGNPGNPGTPTSGNPGNDRDVGRAGEKEGEGFNAPSEGGPGTKGKATVNYFQRDAFSLSASP